jgi:hypothetical protein
MREQIPRQQSSQGSEQDRIPIVAKAATTAEPG